MRPKRVATVNPSSDKRSTNPLPISLREELVSIYRELTAEIDALGVTCWARSHCCDFNRAEHRLYASSVEVAYVLETHSAKELRFDGPLCPFWQDGLCTERERRPLGCRTYFCDKDFTDRLQELYETYYSRLQEAAASSGVSWSYGSFVEQLKEAATAQRPK